MERPALILRISGILQSRVRSLLMCSSPRRSFFAATFHSVLDPSGQRNRDIIPRDYVGLVAIGCRRAKMIADRKSSSGDRQLHWPQWARPLLIVKPDTMVRWYRKGFHLYWRFRSRNKQAGRPIIGHEARVSLSTLANLSSRSHSRWIRQRHSGRKNRTPH